MPSAERPGRRRQAFEREAYQLGRRRPPFASLSAQAPQLTGGAGMSQTPPGRRDRRIGGLAAMGLGQLGRAGVLRPCRGPWAGCSLTAVSGGWWAAHTQIRQILILIRRREISWGEREGRAKKGLQAVFFTRSGLRQRDNPRLPRPEPSRTLQAAPASGQHPWRPEPTLGHPWPNCSILQSGPDRPVRVRHELRSSASTPMAR